MFKYYKTLYIDNERFTCASDYLGDFEMDFREKGLPGIPKDGITEIYKQDITDHPEKFDPFIYARSVYYGITLEDLVKVLEIGPDGKWIMKQEVQDINEYAYAPGGKDFNMFLNYIQEDVAYIKKHYPELYKELLGRNKVSDLEIGFDATKDTKKYPKITIIDNHVGYFKIKLEPINDSTVETNKPIVEKPISQEKQPKKNTTVEHLPVKEKETKVEISIESFNDLMKSISPEQLNMKLNIAGEGEPVKEVTVSDFMNQINGFANALKNMEENAKSGTLIVGAPVEKAHTAKDIDFNNPEELVRVDEINYTHIAEAFD